MDEQLYASLLQRDDDDNNDNNSQFLAVLLSSSNSSSNGSCRITVACRSSRKRSSHDDPVKYTIQYFTFLDDSRMFAHLDALLTRLAPLKSLSVASTEITTENTCKMSQQQARRARQMSTTMKHLTELLTSRSDVFVGNASAVDVIPNMPKPSNTVHSTLTTLLGGEGTDRYVVYKGFLESLNEHGSICLRAIGFLLHQLSVTSSDEDGYEMQRGHLNSHLAMDRTAAECINLLPIKGVNTEVLVGGTETNNSIYGVLNTPMKSKMGSRLLQLWLRQPLVDLKEIQTRQHAVTTLVENSLERDALREEGLAAISSMDLDALSGKLEIYSASSNATKALEALYKLHLFATRGLPVVLNVLANFPDGDPLIEKLQQGLIEVSSDLEQSVQLVEAVLDMDVAPRDYLVKSSYHEHLGDIRQELDQIQEELDFIHRDMNDLWNKMSGSSSDQVRLETADNNSDNNKKSTCCWQFRIPDTNASKILQKDSGITVHRLLKNGVYFSTKELRQLGSKKQDLLVEYQSHQKEIVQNAMAVGVTYVPVLERASILLAQLDVLQSLAHVAANFTIKKEWKTKNYRGETH